MPGIDVSMYGAPQVQPPNVLGMVGQYAQAQNALNQNQLFQQTFRARQALGPLAQQSIGPDGQMDYDKFAVLISAHPDTAWMAPDIINGIVQRQLTQAQTVKENLSIAQTRADAMGRYAGAAIAEGDEQNGIPRNNVMAFGANLHALHLDAGGDAAGTLKFLSGIGLPPGKDGQPDYTQKYNPQLAYKQLKQLQIAQQTAAETIGQTNQTFTQNYGGGDLVGTRNIHTGAVTPSTGPGIQPGGVIPKTAGPGVPTVSATGAKGQTLVGQPLPPQAGGAMPGGAGGASAPPLSPTGKDQSQVPPYAGGPAGPTTTTSLSPVQEGRLKAMVPYTQATNDAGTKSLQMNQIMDEMDKARSQFKTGGGMDGFVAVAKGLQAMGVSDPTVDRIAGGNLGAAQEYGKLQAQLAAAVLKNALMPGAGRILQSEYQTFTKANANWDTDPRAIDKMFSFMRTQNGINVSRMSLLNAITQAANKDEPLPKGMNDLADFEPWFNANLIKRGIISGGTKKLLEGAATSDPANIVAPPAQK